MRDTFSDCHPAVNFLYFALVLAFSMCLMHPACLVISLTGACCYLAGLYGLRELTPEVVSAIMCEEKPNQREKIILRGDKVRSLIPKNIPISQTEDYVLKALEHYSRFLRQRADRDSR